MLTMKDVIREGHPTLKLKAKEMKIPLGKKDKNTLKLMMEFIENSLDPVISEELDLRAGVGLAAPQINISKQMIVIKTMDELDEIELELEELDELLLESEDAEKEDEE